RGDTLVLRSDLANHFHAAGRILASNEIEIRLGRIVKPIADNKPARPGCGPTQGGAIVVADHPLHDVVSIHLSERGAQVVGFIRRGERPSGDWIGGASFPPFVRSITMHVNVDDWQVLFRRASKNRTRRQNYDRQKAATWNQA